MLSSVDRSREQNVPLGETNEPMEPVGGYIESEVWSQEEMETARFHNFSNERVVFLGKPPLPLFTALDQCLGRARRQENHCFFPFSAGEIGAHRTLSKLAVIYVNPNVSSP